MFRAIVTLAILLGLPAPVSSGVASEQGMTIAQQERPVQQSPKRDCESRNQEGVS
jgi:hypothetical protein